MLCEEMEDEFSKEILHVLILVLMEDALRDLERISLGDLSPNVLILVLMEDALRECHDKSKHI